MGHGWDLNHLFKVLCNNHNNGITNINLVLLASVSVLNQVLYYHDYDVSMAFMFMLDF